MVIVHCSSYRWKSNIAGGLIAVWLWTDLFWPTILYWDRSTNPLITFKNRHQMPFCIAKKTNWPHYPHVASRLVRCSSFPKHVKAYILFQFVKCLLRNISHHHLEWRWKWFLLNPSLLFFIPVKNITYFIWDSFQIVQLLNSFFFIIALMQL